LHYQLKVKKNRRSLTGGFFWVLKKAAIIGQAGSTVFEAQHSPWNAALCGRAN
jgi:hypothetical protein